MGTFFEKLRKMPKEFALGARKNVGAFTLWPKGPQFRGRDGNCSFLDVDRCNRVCLGQLMLAWMALRLVRYLALQTDWRMRLLDSKGLKFCNEAKKEGLFRIGQPHASGYILW